MTLLGSIAAMILKKASGSIVDVKTLMKNKLLYVGAIIYIISAVINIVLLRYYDYSIVLPLTSITYLWTIILSHIIMRESINVYKITGIMLIIVGCVSIIGIS